MYFLLDENVPKAVADMIVSHGHQAEFIRDSLPEGSADPLVAMVSEEASGVLVSFDGDFEKIAPRVPDGQRVRFRKLCRIWLCCGEPQAAGRMEKALAFIQSEYDYNQTQRDTRMLVWISKGYLKTHR
jgi:predicted nuclease of predicted toxin-antitoxin system